jgi:protein-tyrosine phosphatase
MPVYGAYWIDAKMPGRLAIMPRPRAGDWLEDDIAGWRAEGIDIVVSLLEDSEIAELELEREQALCERNGISFLRYPIADRDVPEDHAHAVALIGDLAARINAGGSVAVHCRAGIGRSALIAAGMLVMLGFDNAEAFDLISKARGVSVPDTDGQRRWVEQFERALMQTLSG